MMYYDDRLEISMRSRFYSFIAADAIGLATLAADNLNVLNNGYIGHYLVAAAGVTASMSIFGGALRRLELMMALLPSAAFIYSDITSNSNTIMEAGIKAGSSVMVALAAYYGLDRLRDPEAYSARRGNQAVRPADWHITHPEHS